jgi:L-ribulose-5-phosphate 3-epimerase
MIWNRLGVLTDEVSANLKEALDFAADNQLKHVEIRMVDGRNVMDLSNEELEYIKQEVGKRRLFVSAIASPVFKCSLDPERPVLTGDTFGQKEENISSHYRKLDRAIDIAKRLGAMNIRIFSFWREQNPSIHEAGIIQHLKAAADRAKKENVLLLPVTEGMQRRSDISLAWLHPRRYAYFGIPAMKRTVEGLHFPKGTKTSRIFSDTCI